MPVTFVDIHSHILHGFDDGAKTFDDSVRMAEMAAEAGTVDIVGTPHYNSQFAFDAVAVQERTAALQAKFKSQIRFHSGCDFHLKHDNIAAALADPHKYAIRQRSYLLVELSDLVIFRTTEADFARLQAAGLKLIITHPERNPLLRQRFEQLRQWVERGCYIQVTGQAITGHFGSTVQVFANELLRTRLAHFVASDGHDTKHRPPALDRAFEYVSKQHGEKYAIALMCLNPMTVLTGELLPPADVPPAKNPWYRLFRKRESLQA